MDEAQSAPLHRFLSFCRLLMLFHPRVGARLYSMHLSGHADLKPGWNAVHSPPGAAVPVRYILIAPDGDSRNSEKKPDIPDAELHRSNESDLPSFEGSLAQRHLLFSAELQSTPPRKSLCAARRHQWRSASGENSTASSRRSTRERQYPG
jgi:hypothetical protein